MAQPAKPIPAGFHSLTPYISVKGAAEAIAFYRAALGAEELYRLDMPDGRVGHAELRIGDSRLMLADEMPDMPDAVARSPRTLGGTTFGLHVYLPDVDAAFRRAIEAGGAIKRPVEDQFYGDRSGTFADPFGHVWTLATRIEDVSPEEMRRRLDKMSAG
ncbi:MAG TPA: VOC family protein [Polyangia bacterium]|jgi:PhnB protein|nr:VOC family protein [Polyangia bacterium]